MKTYTHEKGSLTLIVIAVVALIAAGAVVAVVEHNGQDEAAARAAHEAEQKYGGEPAMEEGAAMEEFPVASEGQTIHGEMEIVEDTDGEPMGDTPSGTEPATVNGVTQSQSQGSKTTVDSGKREVITLAGGCFWCIEAFLQEAPGVVDAVSGYAGGREEDATYKKVSTGTTGHREAVQVTYDPERISTEEVLDVFWSSIDPTDAGGQFADRGSQYTTAIFYHTEAQRVVAEDSKRRLEASGAFDKPIATKVLPLTTFFVAEEYHQDYYKKAAEHYERYKKASGRADFVEETWAKDAALYFLEQEQASDTSMWTKREYSDAEIAALQKMLPADVYHIVAEDGTEPAYKNAYFDNHEAGIYVDVVTGDPLFSSTHKYDSGTGWPSFWTYMDGAPITTNMDFKIGTARTEVRSPGGHLGHVFNDGPKEHGGKRYCMNSLALEFVPKEEMAARGYGDYLSLFN